MKICSHCGFKGAKDANGILRVFIRKDHKEICRMCQHSHQGVLFEKEEFKEFGWDNGDCYKGVLV
jgi:hypothetical protein